MHAVPVISECRPHIMVDLRRTGGHSREERDYHSSLDEPFAGFNACRLFLQQACKLHTRGVVSCRTAAEQGMTESQSCWLDLRQTAMLCGWRSESATPSVFCKANDRYGCLLQGIAQMSELGVPIWITETGCCDHTTLKRPAFFHAYLDQVD